ncbi:membrane-bound lytic murein transglycosylase MltF [Reinekea blandensis]|uniref:Predicted soluble lytic transglycosylase fused to an ABC-type amino acid-binding protein n=1 Tax=Reinekea blandensis MED297 TaxID=314283 RepID=A4BJD1_9GAMM|nr:membrane-bound lytic murein transglycosylase MltF [Reinekea blandensis]EAR07789.1 predicted soluble lytic transglycosylase fused to an ABC-type amino acid-binding protein [Reinekea sp. MED297] [Reinekea blandensis MED297]
MRILWVNPVANVVKLLLILSIGSIFIAVVARGFDWRNHWEQIESRGYLSVAVRESEGIYWPEGNELTGFEHDLILELERHLGLPIRVFAVRDLDDLYRALEVGAVDMALPGTSHGNDLSFPTSIPYTYTDIGLVSSPDGDDRELLPTGLLDPLAHAQAAEQLLNDDPQRTAVYEQGRLSAELFTLVDMQELHAAIVDERDFQLQQTVFPTLDFQPLSSESRPISVIFQSEEDTTLQNRVNDVLQLFSESGMLTQMLDRYFGEALEFDYVDNLTFEKHLNARLPQYESMFREYAAQYGIDWRLLAAVAYQESHWRANARSPTGVRGLMMITLNTAADMGITNRLDPEQSTRAGTQYLTSLKGRIPARITEPDRTWFALAAYNVGLGHLEDARKITELLGDDPDKWIDVRKHLPKLALKDYYPWTRHGYARGAEPVVYVANIRRFYDTLKKLYPQQGEVVEPDRLDALPEATVPVFPGQ